MSIGRLAWTVIKATALLSWLAVGGVFLWHWIDPDGSAFLWDWEHRELTTFLAGGLLLVPDLLDRLGVKRRMVGDEDGEMLPPPGPVDN